MIGPGGHTPLFMWGPNPLAAASPAQSRLAAAASSASVVEDGPEAPAGTLTYCYDPKELGLRPHDASFSRPPDPPPLRVLASWLIRRFKIAICTVPLVGALLFIRWLLWQDPKNPSVAGIDAIIVAPVITCVVFVMSTVFGNVIADYKESEKLPAELVAYFQSLMTFSVSEARARHFDHRPMCRQIELMLLPVLSTLDDSMDNNEFRRTSWDFGCAAANFRALAHRGRGLNAHDHVELEGIEHAITEIKKKWTRIHDIGRLSIVLPAYTVMDTLCFLLSAILLCADYKSGAIPPSSALMAISVFAYVAFYLNLMVRSLDDPFSYPPQFQFRSYCRSALPQQTLLEDWQCPSSVDFACLTCDLGSNLRRLCRTEPEALEQLLAKPGTYFSGHH
jgi:hypothetical protein